MPISDPFFCLTFYAISIFANKIVQFCKGLKFFWFGIGIVKHSDWCVPVNSVLGAFTRGFGLTMKINEAVQFQTCLICVYLLILSRFYFCQFGEELAIAYKTKKLISIF